MTEFQVNTTTIGNQSNSTVAIDADGDFIISWQSDGQDGTKIYAQRYNTDGTPQGGEFQVNTGTTGNQYNPVIAIDTDGDFVISWQSDSQGGTDIYARRYNNLGVAQGSEFKVNTYTTSDQANPIAVAMDSSGDFVISWISSEEGFSYEIYAQRYNNLGVAQGNEFKVNTYTTSDQYNSTVAMDADGDFVISWQSFGQDGSSNGIYAQRYNNLGVAQGGEFKVNNYTSNNQANPTVAMDTDGNFVISWQSDGQDGSINGIYAQRYNNLGVAQGGEFKVNTYTTSDQTNPIVAMNAGGDFVVSWQSDGQDGSGNGIYAQLNINNGIPPIISASASALAYTEKTTIAIDSSITVSDLDSDNLASATISITSGFASAQDTLTFTNQNGITGSYDSTTGVLTLTGSSTVANYQTALRSITYTNNSDNPSLTPRTISFIVNDGAANSTAITRDINITAVNDAPVAVNDSITTKRNIPVIISATTLLSNDKDVDVSDVLSITGFTQPSQGSLVNNNDGTYTYTPAQNYYGFDSFTYSISDGHGGNSTATVNLTINQYNVINGTLGADNLNGTVNIDVISGLQGNDTLQGLGDNDTLDGADGNDSLDGGAGVDSLIGGKGNDIYIVDNLNDIILESLNAGTDLVKSSVSWVLGNNLENLTLTGSGAIYGTGNSFNNILIGNTGANILNGENGNDNLFGDSDNDTLLGGAGNDTLDGGLGSDSLNGGVGNDIYIVDNLNDIIIEGLNAGTDLVKSSVSWVLGNNLENLTLAGSGVINGTGNSLNNILIGNTGANILNGEDGNDSLFGSSGNDSLLGSAGDDTLDGGLGSDSLNGGAGNDIYTVDNLNDSIIEGLNSGTDLIKSSVNWVLADNLENLTLTGSGVINGTGNSLNNILTGNSGANTLNGIDGNDSLFGSSGNDTLLGGVGDDSLNGGVGTDSLYGGLGNDIYTVDNVNDLIVEDLNAGTDLVNSSVNWVLGNNLENLTLTGTGAISGTGNIFNNILMGNNAANTLTGGDGNDSLFGNSGNDTLFGSAGDDLIAGGVGRDVLTGETGQDSFNLTGTRIGGYDTIADFTLGEDTILISKAEFGLVQSQNTTLDSGLFRLGTTAIAASDRFMYDQTTGNLFFDADGIGKTAQVIQIAQFSNQVALSSANITVIA
ncbi:cadherin-like domain-containing protein [Nostoc cf. edaphicum LEGE 07299]|uniref:Cadherin-like domain-containing protein n=1 Tax=Nostoc cf. edaphicum LEGE 07299 TaxID=2777974 RepID=A0ABR9TVT0_9NOSO|nr:cadherin-like domain-containing protein [Nostoc edaphicum]MBE9103937.1 cadherin-like domain-containing protein [Nostoc cf. edaphicum LEGE 07299]